MLQSTLSRRALVTAAAVVPALALPASAALAQDAELIALGPELEAVIRDWVFQQNQDRRLSDQIDAETERLTGVKFEDVREDGRDARTQYWKVRDEVLARLSDPNDADENSPWNDILARAFPLARRILSMRAATLVGLTVQARAASLENAEFWDHPQELDSQDGATKGLIESLCAYVGVKPVAMELQS